MTDYEIVKAMRNGVEYELPSGSGGKGSLTYSGLIAGENLSVGDVVTKNANNQLVKVSLSNQGTPHQMWIVRKATTSGDPVEVDISGISNKMSGLTAGANYFVGSTAGQLTTTRGSGYLVGTALNSSDLDMKYFFTDTNFGTDVTLYTFANESDSFTAPVDMKVKMTYTVSRGSTVKSFIAYTQINGNTVDTFNTSGTPATYTYDATLSAGDTLSISVSVRGNYGMSQTPTITTSFVMLYC